MINAGRGYLQQAPWIVFGPGAALFTYPFGGVVYGHDAAQWETLRRAPEPLT